MADAERRAGRIARPIDDQLVHVSGRLARSLRMVGLLQGCSPERHEAVAGELAEGSVGLEHDLRERAEEIVERGHYVCRSEEHTSELQSLMRISYAVFCLK